MTWLNPAAFLGLLALAIPILVHLFGRRIARRQRFPSLRLLRDVRATPATRSRPSDLLLLILRCGVVLVAVLALAQPRWWSPDRQRNASVPIRMILVDTSASMHRLTSEGRTALDRARLLAREALDSAGEGMVVETAQPGANIAGAVSWLGARSGLRELVIVSDFQVGALGDGNLASLPDGLGLGLRRIAVAPDAGPTTTDSGHVSMVVQEAMTRASWRDVRADRLASLTVSTSPRDSGAARAMLDAVSALAPGMPASNRSVTIIFPGSMQTKESSGAFRSVWQGDLVLALQGNELLNEVARGTNIARACEAPGAVVARTRSGQVVAAVAALEQGVVIHSCADVGSLAGTALLAAVAGAMTPRPALEEREPNVVPDDVLRTWERPPTAFAPRGHEETSPDGRWFWLGAIALLVLEQVVRRGAIAKAMSTDQKANRERAA